jgi:DNA-binding PadR family transcriptional regulator
MTDQDDVQANLPLTEATFYIMLSLAPEPRHGYAIMKDVQTLSESRVVLSTGTLYGALKRLLEQGWIERVDEVEEPPGGTAVRGRPRKAYTLTRLGQHILDAEITRLQTLVSVARRRATVRQA